MDDEGEIAHVTMAEHEARVARADLWAGTIAGIGRDVVRWSGIGYCAYRASLVLIEWSGKTTAADLTLAMEGGGWPATTALVGITVGLAGIAYGRTQAHLRRETIRHFESRTKALERALDPNRSSSGLTPSGETPPDEE